jgi:hypothetical protein
MIRIAKKGYVAVVPPKFTKIEVTLVGGMAQLDQKNQVHLAPLVMDYAVSDSRKLTAAAGWHAILEGTAGLAASAKKIYEINGQPFCLIPESEVLGFQMDEEKLISNSSISLEGLSRAPTDSST